MCELTGYKYIGSRNNENNSANNFTHQSPVEVIALLIAPVAESRGKCAETSAVATRVLLHLIQGDKTAIQAGGIAHIHRNALEHQL